MKASSAPCISRAMKAACEAGVEELLKAVPENLRGKVTLLCALVCPERSEPRTPRSLTPRLTGDEGAA